MTNPSFRRLMLGAVMLANLCFSLCALAGEIPSVQAAVSKACDGTTSGTARLPAGLLITDSVTVPAGCVLEGAGANNTVLKAKGMQQQILYINGNHVTVRDLKLDGNGTTNNAILWHFGDYGLVEDVEITGTQSDGAPRFNYGDGITVADFAGASGTNHTTFRNLKIHDVRRNCIFLGRGNYNTIMNLNCVNYGLMGVDVEPDGMWSAAYGTLLNSKFVGTPGVGSAIYITGGAATVSHSRGWHIIGNTVAGAGDCVPNTSCDAGTVGAVTLAADDPVFSNNIVMNSNGNGYAISGVGAVVTGNIARNNGQGRSQNRGFAVNNSHGIYARNSCTDTQANPTQGYCFGENNSSDDYNQYRNNVVGRGIGGTDNLFLGPHDQWSNSGTPPMP